MKYDFYPHYDEARKINTIVQKDEVTGETSIKIPVKSKETVSNLLGLIGKLFAQ